LKQAVLAEEEAVLNQYKVLNIFSKFMIFFFYNFGNNFYIFFQAKVNSPVNGNMSSINNPFLVSSEPIVDLFSSPAPATQVLLFFFNIIISSMVAIFI